MKVACFTDIHGAVQQVTQTIEGLTEIHLVILGGDLTAQGRPEEAEEILDRCEAALKRNAADHIPILAVSGNMDSPEVDQYLNARGVSLNGQGVQIGPVGFFGVSACPPSPLHTPYEVSESELAAWIKQGFRKVAQAPLRVLVSHTPPWDTKVDRVYSGIHAGSHSVREFVLREQPALVICGHIHEARGQDRLEQSLVLNCGPARSGHYALVEIDEAIEIEAR